MSRPHLCLLITLHLGCLLLLSAISPVSSLSAERFKPPLPITIIDVDDDSITTLGRWPWGRDIHARLIRTLSPAGPTAIIFDFLFSEADSLSPQKDRALAEALRENQRVFLAFAFHSPTGRSVTSRGEVSARQRLLPFRLSQAAGAEETLREGAQVLLPIEPLLSSAAGVGFVNLFPTGSAPSSGLTQPKTMRGGVVTKVPLVMRFGGELYPSLPLAAAIHLLKIPPQRVVVRPGEAVVLGGKKVPIDDEGDLRLAFAPPFSKFRHFSYVQVLNREVPLSAHFGGAIAIVGVNATGLADYHPTLISNYFPGTEILATALDYLLNR